MNEVKRIAYMHTTDDRVKKVIDLVKVGSRLKDTETGSYYKVVDIHIYGVLADRYINRRYITFKDIAIGVYDLEN